MNKILSVIFFFLVCCSIAWPATRHTDYSTGMEIKYCNECHLSNDVAPNHGAMWMKEHRLMKEKLPSNCNDCHQQSFCLDCHKGGGIDRSLHVSNSGVDYTPMTHRTDFRELHPIKARQEPASCVRCHDTKKFCNECHNRFNRNELAFESHRRQFRDVNLPGIGRIHAGFADLKDMNPSLCRQCHVSSIPSTQVWSASHAREARRNLQSCQSCHPDGDVCIKCHSSGMSGTPGLHVNPHPRNWSNVKGRFKSASSKTCLRCHAPGTF